MLLSPKGYPAAESRTKSNLKSNWKHNLWRRLELRSNDRRFFRTEMVSGKNQRKSRFCASCNAGRGSVTELVARFRQRARSEKDIAYSWTPAWPGNLCYACRDFLEGLFQCLGVLLRHFFLSSSHCFLLDTSFGRR